MIDTHQHFWRLSRGGYGWMPEDLPVLNRDYEPEDLEPLLKASGVTGTVTVQADDNEEETRFLLSLADRTPWVLGVVGWVDLENQAAPARIEELARHPKFLGIRPMIQDIPDVDWMLRPELATGLKTLQDLDLTFDALVLQKHLPNLAGFRELYPDLRIVIDHCAKPVFAEGQFDLWAAGMSRMAESPNTFCKISGLLTEAGPESGIDDVAPYIDHVVSDFGPTRVMFGSDWPVLNLAGSYARWHGMLRRHFAESPDFLEQEIGITSALAAYPRVRASYL